VLQPTAKEGYVFWVEGMGQHVLPTMIVQVFIAVEISVNQSESPQEIWDLYVTTIKCVKVKTAAMEFVCRSVVWEQYVDKMEWNVRVF
jgi:hypothetical protein